MTHQGETAKLAFTSSKSIDPRASHPGNAPRKQRALAIGTRISVKFASAIQRLRTELARAYNSRWRSFIWTVLLHGLPVFAASTIIILNIKGHYIGKQLQGNINQDGTKRLALQITAKLHELLVLASLSDILWSLLLELLVFGKGAPLGALTVGDRFTNVSYLLSGEFFAMCRARYGQKGILIMLTIVCTLLGVVVGPSSATAMAPRVEGWVADHVQLPVDTTSEQMWPAQLDGTNLPQPMCLNTSELCARDDVWSSLAVNLFSYWGTVSYGSLRGMPEAVNMNGADAMRMMRVRLRGPFSLYAPELSVATIQPVSTARIVNGLRMIWSSDNTKKCTQRRVGYCDYQDIRWSVDTFQPSVYAACNMVEPMDVLQFPTMERPDGILTTSASSAIIPNMESNSSIALEAVQLDGVAFSKVSVGVIVRVSSGTPGESVSYACAIDARWADSVVETTFNGSPYIVDGTAHEFFIHSAKGSTYRAPTVTIDQTWASAVLSAINPTTNMTVFETLYTAGPVPDPLLAADKIEAILPIMVAENMARIRRDAEIALAGFAGNYQYLQWKDVRNSQAVSAGAQRLSFRATVTGYGYGIDNGGNGAVAPLLSVMVLIVYCVIVVVHFAVRCFRHCVVVNAWKGMMETLVLALQTTLDPVPSSTPVGVSKKSILSNIVTYRKRNDRAEMVVERLSGTKASYQRLDSGDLRK